MQSRRGFFQALLAASAGALAKAHAAPSVSVSPWREVPMESVFMHVRRKPFQLEYFGWAEQGFAVGDVARLAHVDFK